ncbi:bacteriophage spanin2 family protein [Chryseobacterium gotjawalense]|uniref:Bacteriophage spanin2 family protein n=1 Tax=Chryseobacterium gotjawalense TaxID=3042315 RepID=A0ABY8RA24_9FLAO|nr:bacteriophage spanin2 family protein [Chryseobacterium sp. wdc7]WHF50810.1 bacteriophage spanin2 family protein [Chryseobacterium sp. wdc7]
MKNIFAFVLFLIMLTSCQTRVVSMQKPLKNNSLELYQKYTVQTNDAKVIKLEVLKLDDENIYGKLKSGEDVIIKKIDVREAKKLDLFSSIALALAAIVAVIIVPI